MCPYKHVWCGGVDVPRTAHSWLGRVGKLPTHGELGELGEAATSTRRAEKGSTVEGNIGDENGVNCCHRALVPLSHSGLLVPRL